MRVCMRACMGVCVHVCVHACVLCMCACVCLYMHACMGGCVRVCMRACMGGCVHACLHGWVRACVHACLHGWVRACVHACLHGWARVCVYVSVRTHVLCSCLVCAAYVHTYMCTVASSGQAGVVARCGVRLLWEGGSQLWHDMPFIPFLCHSLLCQQRLHFSHPKHSLLPLLLPHVFN